MSNRDFSREAAGAVHGLARCPFLQAPGEPCADCAIALAGLELLETPSLFPADEVLPWLREWQDMPEYTHQDLAARYQLLVNFASEADLVEFGRLVGQSLSGNDAARQLRSIWFPPQEIGRFANKRYVDLAGRNGHESAPEQNSSIEPIAEADRPRSRPEQFVPSEQFALPLDGSLE